MRQMVSLFVQSYLYNEGYNWVYDIFYTGSKSQTEEVKFNSLTELNSMDEQLLDRAMDSKGLRVEIPAGVSPYNITRILRILADKIDTIRFADAKDRHGGL